MQITPIDRAFPDQTLLVSYDDCAKVVGAVLNAFPHGELKSWAEGQTPSFNYTTLVNLKNSKLKKPAPQVVKKLLLAFGFVTELLKDSKATGKQVSFLFTDIEALSKFKEKLDSI